MVAVTQPRAVVAGEHHQRVVGQPVLVERLEDLADGPVDLHDHVAVEPGLRLPLELVADEQRDVRHRVGDVQEERLVLVRPDELHRPLGVLRGELRLVLGLHVRVGGRLVLDERQRRVALGPLGVVRPHVVGVRQAEVRVEPVAGRQEPRVVAEVPLAHHAGGVALRLEELREGRLGVADADAGVGPERAVDAQPVGVAPG